MSAGACRVRRWGWPVLAALWLALAGDARADSMSFNDQPHHDGPHRVALVIGNQNYANVAKLQKSDADANAYAQILRDKGFDEVIARNDLTIDGMDEALDEFTAAIHPGDTAVFIYAGHGWSDGAQNYIVGTDAPREFSPSILKRQSLPIRNGINGIVDLMSSAGATLKVAIIDACRDNPFDIPAPSRSLATTRGFSRQSVDQGDGTFMVFSAGVGQTALDGLTTGDPDPHGLFTRKFLPLLRQDITLLDAAKSVQLAVRDAAATVSHDQRPAIYDETLGDNACISETCTSSLGAVDRKTDVPPTAEPGEDVWASDEGSTDPAIFDAFRTLYPNSPHAAEAGRRAASLRASAMMTTNEAPASAAPVSESGTPAPQGAAKAASTAATATTASIDPALTKAAAQQAPKVSTPPAMEADGVVPATEQFHEEVDGWSMMAGYGVCLMARTEVGDTFDERATRLDVFVDHTQLTGGRLTIRVAKGYSDANAPIVAIDGQTIARMKVSASDKDYEATWFDPDLIEKLRHGTSLEFIGSKAGFNAAFDAYYPLNGLSDLFTSCRRAPADQSEAATAPGAAAAPAANPPASASTAPSGSPDAGDLSDIQPAAPPTVSDGFITARYGIWSVSGSDGICTISGTGRRADGADGHFVSVTLLADADTESLEQFRMDLGFGLDNFALPTADIDGDVFYKMAIADPKKFPPDSVAALADKPNLLPQLGAGKTLRISGPAAFDFPAFKDTYSLAGFDQALAACRQTPAVKEAVQRGAGPE